MWPEEILAELDFACGKSLTLPWQLGSAGEGALPCAGWMQVCILQLESKSYCWDSSPASLLPLPLCFSSLPFISPIPLSCWEVIPCFNKSRCFSENIFQQIFFSPSPMNISYVGLTNEKLSLAEGNGQLCHFKKISCVAGVGTSVSSVACLVP